MPFRGWKAIGRSFLFTMLCQRWWLSMSSLRFAQGFPPYANVWKRLPDCFLRRGGRSRSTTSLTSKSQASSESSAITEQMRQTSESSFAHLCEHYDSKKNELSFAPPHLCRSPADASKYLTDHAIKTCLFDCDGVVYRAPAPAPDATGCIQALLEDDCRVFFVTNNSAANPQQLREKLVNILGLDGNVLSSDMMISTAWTAAQYLKQQLLKDFNSSSATLPTAYVIGSDGLKEEIRNSGIQVVDAFDHEEASMSREELANFDFEGLEPVNAVVVGHDTGFSFRKLSIANVLLQRNPRALFVATNKDAFDLVGADCRHIPGNGSLVAALEFSCGRQAINVGKPSQLLLDLLQSVHGVNAKEGTMFVGDRLDTDVKFALETGMHAALVMTGVTTATQLQELEAGTSQEPLPTLIVPHVGYFAKSSEVDI